MSNKEEDNFSINAERNLRIPRLKYKILKDAVLGINYSLNINFVSAKTIQKLNAEYRKVNKATDTLSFPISKKEGEIYLCLKEIKKHKKEYRHALTDKEAVGFVVIHSLLHLYGMQHGSKMEKAEDHLVSRFLAHEKNNNSGYRHRNTHRKSGNRTKR